MKWSQIKTAILDKLSLTSDEAQQESYLDKFQYLANEGAVRIANDAKENIKEFSIIVFDTSAERDAAAIADGAILDPDDNIYRLNGVEYHVINTRIVMPSDFISHGNEVTYEGDVYAPKIIYLGRTAIKILSAGEYTFVYNALYPEIVLSDIVNDTELDIDTSVLYCLPSYVASQLLSQTDPQRSAILRNEFELQIARLDNNVVATSQSYNNEGGWL